MKRKLVQHGKSTLIVSLPSKWAKKYSLKRGNDVHIEEKGDFLQISPSKTENKEEIIEFNISGMESMAQRYIGALYKKGIDTIKLEYDNPNSFFTIKDALEKSGTLGYEIVDINLNNCLIRNVGGDSYDFDMLLKKTFILLLTMSTQIIECVKEKNKEKLKMSLDCELSNNTFTTICRRYLNKKGTQKYNKVGPIYYIVEELEKAADDFKKIVFYLIKKENMNLDKKTVYLFELVNKYILDFFELFQRFDKEYVYQMRLKKEEIEKIGFGILEKGKDRDVVVTHFLMSVTDRIFNFVGPYIINTL